MRRAAGRRSQGARGGSSGPVLRGWLPLALGVALASALGVAALRVDLLRVRYGLADALQQEQALLEQQRQARARVGELRDPARLGRLARDLGLSRPRRIIDLSSTSPPSGQP